MRNAHCTTWNEEKNTEKMWKLKNTHCRPRICRETLKNLKNEKCTLQDLDYGEKTENPGK